MMRMTRHTLLSIALMLLVLPATAGRVRLQRVLIEPGLPGKEIVLESGEPPREIQRFAFDALPACVLVSKKIVPSLTTRYAGGTERSAAVERDGIWTEACPQAE